MSTSMKALVLAIVLVAAAAAQSGVDASQASEIFSEIDGILKELHDITGFKIKHRGQDPGKCQGRQRKAEGGNRQGLPEPKAGGGRQRGTGRGPHPEEGRRYQEGFRPVMLRI